MDIGYIDLEKSASEGAWCDISLPGETEPSGIRIKLRGFDSPELSRFIDEWRQSGEADIGSEESMIQCIIPATVAIENLEYKGKKVTPKNFEKVLREQKNWLVRQCFNFMAARGNFFKRPEKS